MRTCTSIIHDDGNHAKICNTEFDLLRAQNFNNSENALFQGIKFHYSTGSIAQFVYFNYIDSFVTKYQCKSLEEDPKTDNNIVFFSELDDLEEKELEEDPDLIQDSIYHLNLAHYLRDFLLNFSTHHCFPGFVQHLNLIERKMLTNINVNTPFL